MTKSERRLERRRFWPRGRGEGICTESAFSCEFKAQFGKIMLETRGSSGHRGVCFVRVLGIFFWGSWRIRGGRDVRRIVHRGGRCLKLTKRAFLCLCFGGGKRALLPLIAALCFVEWECKDNSGEASSFFLFFAFATLVAAVAQKEGTRVVRHIFLQMGTQV